MTIETLKNLQDKGIVDFEENEILIQHRKEELLKKELWKSAIYVRLNEQDFTNLNLKANFECVQVTKLLEIFVNGFLTDDKDLLKFLNPKINEERLKKETEALSKIKEKKDKIVKYFGLSEEEKNSIYDLFAEDIEGSDF